MGALGLETSKRRKGGFSLEVYNLQCLTVNHLCSHSQMEVTLRLKFTQHADLRAMLLGTRDAELVEVRCFGANYTSSNQIPRTPQGTTFGE